MTYEFMYAMGWRVVRVEENGERREIGSGFATFEGAVQAASYDAGGPITFVCKAIG